MKDGKKKGKKLVAFLSERYDTAERESERRKFAQRSNPMQSSLATIADEFFVLLTRYIDGNGFVALMMTGNRLLRYKLRLNCSSLRFRETATIAFPFAALKLANLRSLSIHGIKEVTTYLDFRERGGLVHSLGHKTLKKLELDFGNAISLFRSSNASSPRLPIRDRFPSLSTLILKGFINPSSLESLLGELPETLTNLSAVHSEYRGVSNSMDLRYIAKLPAHLKSLTMRGYKLWAPLSSGNTLSELCPPNVRHLDLDILNDINCLNHCPPKLKTLRLTVAYQREEFIWKSSKIPKGLKKLFLNVGGACKLHLDAPLPSTLEHMDVSNYSKFSDELTIDDMPLALKSAPCDWISNFWS